MSFFYQVMNVTENVYRITSVEGVFFDLIVGNHKAMLIDTGYAFGDVKSVVRRITEKPLVIVNTHGHVDHACGNCQFDESVYIGEEDMELCAAHTAREMRLHVAKLAEHTMDWQQGKEVYGLPDDFDLEKYISCESGNLVPCQEGDVFDLGGVTISVYNTPGHTPGGRSFFYQEKEWLYVGDAANQFLWLFMPEATDRKTHLTTLDRILGIPSKRIFGGHAPQPMSHTDIVLYKKVAIEADYEKGEPFSSPIAKGQHARVCCLEGMTFKDIGKPGFASIVLSKDK